MPRIRARAIRVSKQFLDPKKYDRAINNFLTAAAEDMRIDLQVSVQTWKRKPKFVIWTQKKGERNISTDNKIYKFVSGGTRVRYATMTKDFQAKTSPGWIGSRQGRGGLAYVSKLKPRPGIKARQFPKAIIKKWKPLLPRLFRRILADELRR